MKRHTLHDGWHLTAVAGPVPSNIAGQELPAAVPGSAHLDLLAADLIPDPYLDRSEAELVWAHRTDWRYTRTLTAPPPADDERVDLVFDGLDTVATVELGGRVLGRTANMHRGYRFDVRGALDGGPDGNDSSAGGSSALTVTFRSALEYAEEIERELGRRDHVYPHPFNMVRKMACSFGWDWGPDLQTAGIWKPVRLERWRTGRLAGLRTLVTVGEDGSGRAEVHAEVERSGLEPATDLVLTATVDGREARVVVPAGATSAVLAVTVPDVALWWPIGYGDQPLYDLDVTLNRADRVGGGQSSEPLDTAARRIGFRTITVDTEPDAIGTPFTVVVNGRPIFVKGANWIPDDHFVTRITRDRLARRVDQAVGAHLNLLRIWGGGIYETEDFYDVCDERGVLVWQDFPFACAAYPEEEPLWSEVEAEARENVARLSSHASLAVWNGANENMWGYRDWGWPEQLAGRSWGLRYYTELLPAIVAELDPTRFYSANSPYNPHHTVDQLHPNDQDHGTRHEWRVWNDLDYTTYRDHIPRFCSEFGFQAPATWTTLTDWVHDEPLTPTSPAFLLHQKAEDGNGKLDRGMAPHLPATSTFEDWHWATQLNQARAVSFAIEHFRSWWPRTAGAIVWQLNDCWSVTSWAAIDGDERAKPLLYGLRHAYAPQLLTVQPRDGRPVLVAVNDRDEPWQGEVRLERQTFAGLSVASGTLELSVPARSVAELPLAEALVTPANPKEEVLVATVGEVRTTHLFAEDVELAYDPNPLKASVVAVAGGYRVEVHATSFTRDVTLLADRVARDAVVDDALVTLLAGETRSFTVHTSETLDLTALTAPLVLRSANSLSSSVVKS